MSDRADDIIPISVALLKKDIQKLENFRSLTIKQKNSDRLPLAANVRELENVLQRAIVLCDEQTINENHIMVDVSCNKSFYKNFDENIKQAII